jgi:hypothetical protein
MDTDMDTDIVTGTDADTDTGRDTDGEADRHTDILQQLRAWNRKDFNNNQHVFVLRTRENYLIMPH